MNRPIKFRQFYKGSFYYWGYIDGDFIYPITKSNDVIVQSDEFTGLLDKNGKEIYKGDWVKGNPIGSTGIREGKVIWMNDGWFVSDESDRDDEKRLHSDFFGKVEVIGPDLLK